VDIQNATEDEAPVRIARVLSNLLDRMSAFFTLSV